jgi:uncharacterized membrane protein
MQTRSKKTLWLVQTAILAAILLVLALTPIGYLKIGVVSLTLLTIPVVIGAIAVGPLSGAVLGAVFGLTSFYQCFGMDPFGAFLLSQNPILTFINCVVPRVLVGLIVGLVFQFIAKRGQVPVYVYAFCAFLGSVLNTAFFLGALVLFFGNLEFAGTTITAIAISLISINALIEAVVCTIIGAGVAKGLHFFLQKKMKSENQ